MKPVVSNQQADGPAPQPVPARLEQAVELHRCGQLALARRLYEEVLAEDPASFPATHLLGVVLLQSGDARRAVELIGAALALNPASAAAHNNLGNAWRELGEHAAAAACYEQAIELKPDYFEAYGNCGVAYRQLKQYARALASQEAAIGINAAWPPAHCNRGIVLTDMGRFAEAVRSFDRALALDARYAEAHNNRGSALLHLARNHEAAVAFRSAIELRPLYAGALCNLGQALCASGDYPTALDCYAQALSIDPCLALAHSGRANAQLELDRHADALASSERALALDAGLVVAHINKAKALEHLGQTAAAIASLHQAVSLDPENAGAQGSLALLELLVGDFERGLKRYEWRLNDRRTGQPNRHRGLALWSGVEELGSTRILLHAEQGLGDTIQFCRYARLVHERGARVVLEVPPPMVELLETLDGVERVMTMGTAVGDIDFQCPLPSLPLAFKTRLDTIPCPARYLRAQPRRVQAWQQRLGRHEKLRIGLSWSGNPAHINDRNRSIPVAQLAPLLDLDAQIVCLQPALREADQALLKAGGKLLFFGAALADFSETAALVEAVDIVISVDTSVAHLAGALGKPVWLLLPFNPDWRWLLGRDDTPWYPSARLFRQASPGDWRAVIAYVLHELRGLMAHWPQAGER